MKKAILQKLKSTNGESISEVLIASLVVALAFVMVASMISASYKIINKTNTAMAAYYDERNAYEAGEAAESAGTVSITNGSGTLTTNVFDSTDVNIKSKTINGNTYISYEAK